MTDPAPTRRARLVSAEEVAAQRRSQGLPDRVEDPGVLARVAAVLRAARRPS